MYFEIWDFETSNMVGDYDSKSEALGVIRDAIAANGPEVALMLALGESDEEGNGRTIATGADLILLAQRAEPSAKTA